MRRWQYRPARDLTLTRAQRLRSARREPDLVEIGVLAGAGAALRGYLAVRQHLLIEGRSRLPAEPPFVMVANHCSHLDGISLAAAVRGARRHCVHPIAAGDTFFTSIASTNLSALALNALPIWRGCAQGHALKELRSRLVEEPCAYILFPEGTRSRDGLMRAFRPGVGMLVAGLDVPVVPCHLTGTFAAWSPQRSLPRAGRVEVRIGKATSFREVPNVRAGWEQIAEALRAAVWRTGERGRRRAECPLYSSST